MSVGFDSQSMVKPLRRVLVKRPDEAFAVQDVERWHYAGRPDLNVAQEEHAALVDILRQAGTEIVFHDEFQADRADAIYVHDPALITRRGAVILRMGKALRRGEEEALARCLEANSVPILARLHGDALAEGGDLVWLDDHTLAVGLGFRTNAEGLTQITEALEGLDVEILPVHLPFYSGPEACLHLMSFISIVDHRLAVIYEPLMPVPFWQTLRDRGFRFVRVPDEEFETMGPNVLALAPGHCLMLQGNPVTKQRLEEAGCQVLIYKGQEISLKAEGGPTCLTRPILRSD